MKLRQCLLSLLVLAGVAGPLAATNLVTETWRSAWGAPRAVAVNPADGSVWAAVGSSLLHLAPDGAVLSRRDDFAGPQGLAVNSADGSCWVADASRNQVVHVSAAGEEVWRGGGFVYPAYIGVYPADGSVWVGQGGFNYATPEVIGKPEVIHLAADGTVLWRSDAYYPATVAVSPADGACWLRDWDLTRIVRLSPSGEETVSVDDFAPSGAIGAGLQDGSVWVADPYDGQVVHLSASGRELWRGGSFTGPDDIAVDPSDGSLWVDCHLPPPAPVGYEVVHLAADGTELWRQGGFGELSSSNIALAANPSDGSVWVADMQRSALVHLDRGGAELFRGQGLDDPVSVVASPADGAIWVADQGRERVVELDQDGQEVRAINRVWPVSLAVNPADGTLWVMDGGSNTAAHYRGDGTELWRKVGPDRPYAVALNPADGSGWVSFFDTVIHLSPSGDELWRGTGFAQAFALAVDPKDGSCWVASMGSASDGGPLVMHLAADGREVLRTPEGIFGEAYSIAVDPRDGSVRVADYVRNEVISLTPWGSVRWRTSVGFVPYSVAVDPRDGACWVAVYGGSSVVLLSADGVILWRGGSFGNPQSVSVDPRDGACWVADTYDSQAVRLERFQFADVPFTHWASDAVYACVAAGIASGYPDGRYYPSQPVTRDQMAVYLARALAGGDAAVPTGPSRAPFTDVGADHWAYRYIAYCAEMGVVQGYSDGSYHPGEVVNRAQMAAYLARAVADPIGEEGIPDYQGSHFSTFADVSPEHWAWRYVEYLFARGIVQGYSSDLYAPEAAVTRDQMAAYLARAFLE
jgi:DNA-binding beta-propeller fold protein YncE